MQSRKEIDTLNIGKMKTMCKQIGKGYLNLWRNFQGYKKFLFYLLHYTFIFALLQYFVFGAFYETGRSFVWKIDGMPEHFTRLVYISQTLRNGIQSLLAGKGWTIPLYDFRTGLTVQDLQIGFPQILAVFFPWDQIDTFYDLYVISTYYFIGLSFSIFGFFFHQKPLPIMIGAVTYTFCGYSLYAGVRHPHFIVPMVYLPLLIIGTEKVLQKEKSYLLLFMVFLSLTTQWGLYFSCMQAIFVLIYSMVRFWDLYKQNRWREFGSLIVRLFIWGGTGVLLASFVAIPSLITIAGSGRIGNDVSSATNMFYYSISRYCKFISNYILIQGNVIGDWTHLGFSVLTLPAIILLFIRFDKKERSLRILWIILTVMLSIPFVGYIMSGFSNIANRFCFAYAFCIAVIVMFMLPQFLQASYNIIIAVYALVILYFAICYFGMKNIEINMDSFIMLLVAMLLLLCCLLVKKQCEKLFLPVCFFITCFSVCYSGFLLYHPSQGNVVSTFEQNAYKSLNQGQYASLNQSKIKYDNQFLRVAGDSITDSDLGLSFYYNLNGLTGYPYFGWSNNYIKWMNEMEIPRYFNKQIFYGLDTRAALLTLANVRYYAERQSETSIQPYGFTEIDQIRNGKNIDVILENQYWLPLGYTYEKYMLDDVYNQLNVLTKQEAQLQAVILKKEPQNTLPSQTNISSLSQKVPYKISETTGLIWENNKLKVTEKNATMTLRFDGIPATETYLRFINLDLTNGASTRRWTLNATTGETTSKAHFAADGFVYTSKLKTQMLDLGYAENGYTNVTITFPDKGTFILDDIEIWCQPMDKYSEQIKSLKKETLENVETNWRGVKGTISVSKDKFLCLAIPYLEGWKAYVDGIEVELYQANTAFMGVELSAGDHEIELRYWLPGLTVGLVLTAIGFLCLLLLIFFYKKKNH